MVENRLARCIECGCDDDYGCDEGCFWLRVDREAGLGVCSSCETRLKDWDAGDRRLSGEAILRRFQNRRICVDRLVAGWWDIECPLCGHVLLVVRPDGLEVSGRKSWLSDGDTLPGIPGRLRPDQKKPDAHYFSLSVGNCPKCSGDYYVISASLIDADLSARSADFEPDDFLSFNVPQTLVEIDACFLEDLWDEIRGEWTSNPLSSWILEVYRTPFGPMHHHTFGPFPLKNSEDVIHPEYGVMACQATDDDPWGHGKSLVLALFDEMRRLVANAGRRDREKSRG